MKFTTEIKNESDKEQLKQWADIAIYVIIEPLLKTNPESAKILEEVLQKPFELFGIYAYNLGLGNIKKTLEN